MQLLSTTILLPQMQFHARHGVLPQERLVGALFTVSLEAGVRFDEALQSDSLEGTVSYADIHQAVKEEMDIPSALLEHVAGRIVAHLFKDFPTIEQIELKLSKRNPPMGADIDAAAFECIVDRQESIKQ